MLLKTRLASLRLASLRLTSPRLASLRCAVVSLCGALLFASTICASTLSAQASRGESKAAPKGEAPKPAARVPELGLLNADVLAVCRAYKADGTHRYFWPRGKDAKRYRGWAGNTKDLRYGGELLFKGDPEGRAYCCGLTFEVFLEAWRRWCARERKAFRIGALDAAGLRRLKTQWFGSAKDKTCLRTALVANGLGVRVGDLEAARAGDFVQLWRANGSGHSVVFLSWVREKGRIVGLRYWSTQKSTRGIGERVERFDRPTKRRLLREQFYLCRVGRPSAKARATSKPSRKRAAQRARKRDSKR